MDKSKPAVLSLQGRTALHIVVNRDDRDLHFVTTLLESGCIPNGKDIKVKEKLFFFFLLII